MAFNLSNDVMNWADQYSPLTAFFGSKPETIQWDPMSLSAEQRMALMQNIRNFPQIQQLGNLYQDYVLGGLGRAGLPNFTDIVKQGGITAQDILMASQPLIKGQIPPDVANQVYRSAAYQNLQSGGGPSFLNALTARDLGTTSLGLMGQGVNMATAGGNAAQQWNQIARSTMLDPQWAMVSPMERASWDLQNQLLQHNTRQAAANIAAQANPTASGLLQLAMTYYGGGMMGGGGGGGGMGGMGGMMGGGAGGGGNIGGKGFYSGVPQAPMLGGGGFGAPGGVGSTAGFGSYAAPNPYMPTNAPGITSYPQAFGAPATSGYDPYSNAAYLSNFPAQTGGGADLWNMNVGNIWGG